MEQRYSDLPRPMDARDVPQHPGLERSREVIVIGGGLAGLSAAIYLARALRDVLVVDAGESLAMWEPEVQNYLGFPDCIDGRDLLHRGRIQAEKYGAEFVREEIEKITRAEGAFHLRGKKTEFQCRRLLLATGVYHLPPQIPSANECIGKSIFFCKDCDGFRVRHKRVLIAGNNEEAVEYALGIMVFTECVSLLTNGEVPHWGEKHDRWLREFKVPILLERIVKIGHESGLIRNVTLDNGHKILADCMFTTRGDVFHNYLARLLGAALDEHGQLVVDQQQRTTVPGLYAAGCVTPTNCQMIIAAGAGAAAAQAINRDLFEESLATGRLREVRDRQIARGRTEPAILHQN